MNILVVKLSAFGDIIHCLPALDDLLTHPEVNVVHWLVDSRYRFVTDIFPKQVIVHEVDMKGAHPWHSIRQTIRDLRRIHFDAILDMQGLIKSAIMARACGTPVYGIDTEKLREKPAGWLQRPTHFHMLDKHVVQQYRRVATAPFSRNTLPDAPLPYTPPKVHADVIAQLSDISAIEKLDLNDQNYAVMHSASAWPTKRLPNDTWVAIARGGIARGLTPVFTWGNDEERKSAHQLAANSGGVFLPERLNMPALSSLLSRAKVIIGPDTGVVHLAAALGSPTITFWGPTPSWRTAPFGEHHRHIESNPACGPCLKRSCNQFICMPSIHPDAILKAVDEIITH